MAEGQGQIQQGIEKRFHGNIRPGQNIGNRNSNDDAERRGDQ